MELQKIEQRKDLYFPSDLITPTTTAGCAAIATVEAGTNDVDYRVLDFDQTTEEHAFFTTRMPEDWNGGALTFRFIWTAAGGSAGETVAWGVRWRVFGNDDAIDQAYTAVRTATDTLIATGDIHISDETLRADPAGTLKAGNLIQVKVTRRTAVDDLAADARLIGVRMYYQSTKVVKMV